MGVHLITGYAGKEHITSDDQASFNSSVFGSGNYVFNKGNKLKAIIKSNTAIDIYDGDLILSGRHVRVTDINTVYFDEGTEGMSRIDLVVAEYKKDATTEIEDVAIKVIKGTETDNKSMVEKPAYNTETSMLLYSVAFHGFTMESIQREFEVIMSNYDYMRNMQYSLTTKRFVLKKDDAWVAKYPGESKPPYYTQKIFDNVDFTVFFETLNPIFFIDTLIYEEETSVKQNLIESYFSFITGLEVIKEENGYSYIFKSKVRITEDIPILVKGAF